MALSHETWAPDSETLKSDRYNGKILFLERPEPTAEIFPVKLNIFTEPQRKPHVKICSQQKVLGAVMFLYGACLVCRTLLRRCAPEFRVAHKKLQQQKDLGVVS